MRQYLVSLYALEQAIVAAAANLDTDKAASWTHSRSEVVDRVRLFDEWRKRLAYFIGVPINPDQIGSPSIVI